MVELQPELAELARRNAQRNGLSSRVEVNCADLRQTAGWAGDLGAETLVVCNPPFFAVGQGRPNPDRSMALARHEVRCTLDQLVAALSQGLPAAAELVLIHLARRREELLSALVRGGLAPRALRTVRPLPGRAPTRLLVVATRNAAPALARPIELPPLLIGERPGRYSREVRRMLNDPD
jgi:tRNA1Val (adenine37-N6)-methyltransferase